MPLLDKIRETVEDKLLSYEDFIHSRMFANSGAAAPLLDYIFSSRGKGIRPLLVMLSSGIYGSVADSKTASPSSRIDRSNISAMMIEMIHTASLIHDDIIDHAYIRRGKPSVNALWGAKKGVLIGDYIFARTFGEGMRSGHYDIVAYISAVMDEICESELTQNIQTDLLNMDRSTYNHIIHGKTATLIGACCGAGAMAAGADSETVSLMKRFGDSLGMAFQIRDDIMDYSLDSSTGKPTCNDLRERKITLPLLTILEQVTPSEKRQLIKRLSSVSRNPDNVEFLYDRVVSTGGLEMASKVMLEHIAHAKSLMSSFPVSPYTEALSQLCDYIGSRDK